MMLSQDGVFKLVWREGRASMFGRPMPHRIPKFAHSSSTTRRPVFTCLPLTVLALGMLSLVGCAAPFSQPAKYDQGVVGAPGTFTISDLKLFSREALINERTRELARLQKIEEEADKVQFTPDFIREIEQIRAISFAFGVKSDPAAGANYRRTQETADLQQEISVLKLKAELEQLRRDLELLRAKLPTQTEPVNTDLGKPGTSGPATAATGVTTPDIKEVIGRVDASLGVLKTMLGTDGKPLASTTVSSNPFDVLRDRQAYLDTVRSMRNAAALDELHDQGNASLIRLNLQATVIPEAAHMRSLGVVQVKIDPTSFDEKAKAKFLSDWLDHVNRQAGYREVDGRFKQVAEARSLDQAGLLSIISIGTTEIALPSATPAGVDGSINDAFAEAGWGGTTSFTSVNGLISSWRADPGPRIPVFEALCVPSRAKQLMIEQQEMHAQLMKHVHEARSRILTYDYARRVHPWLLAQGVKSGFASNVARQHAEAMSLMRNLHPVLSSIGHCDDYVKTRLPLNSPLIAWGDLMSQLNSGAQDGQARIYEVGPREQVQQISTVARSANSLALAASVAASVPGSGVAADAALGYAKQAIGRASTLERVPSVVGYAVGGQQTFGWVFGPRASIDPSGALNMEQMLKPYDLSVDMSVPWWWPGIKLKVTTQWGPSPRQLASGTIPHGADTRDIEIPVARRAPDYDWFTRTLLGMNDRLVRIDEVVGGPVNACTPSTLVVNGPNVWRAEKVMVLGKLLDSNAFTVAPDMRGILVNVPAIALQARTTSRGRMLRVMTPFMANDFEIEYKATSTSEDCKPNKVEAADDSNKLVIEKTNPDLYFVVPSKFEIQVQGKNLDKVTKVTLHGQPVTIKPISKTSLKLLLTEAGTQSIPTSEAAKLEIYTSDGKSESITKTLTVRIVNQKGN